MAWNKKNVSSFIFLILFAAILMGFYSIAFRPQNEISEAEQRTLQKIPSFSFGKFTEGTFQSEMDQAGRRGILQGSGSLDRRSTHQETARPEVRTARQAIGQTGIAAVLQEKEHPGEKGRARGGITETGQTGLRIHDL